jgi:hypothetical protein
MVVVSPLQLISAFELMALRARPGDEVHVIVSVDTVNGRSKNLPQMEAILKAYDEAVTLHWALWPKPVSRWLPHLKLARRRTLAEAARKIGSADWLFLGGFKRLYLPLVRRLCPSELIIGDDGTCLLRKTESASFRRKIERFVKRAAAGRPLVAEYFTCFRSENLKLPVIENEFSRLARMAEGAEMVDEVHIIGSAFASKNEFTEEVYLDALRQVTRVAKRAGDRIVYLPHRWERDDQLARIERLFAGERVEIRRNDMPIELAYATSAKVPRAICGFSSTALVTLPKVLRGKPIRFTACQIDFAASLMSAEKIAGYRALYGLILRSIGADRLIEVRPPLGKSA